MKNGLSYKFKLKQGRFSLTTGEEKVRDNLSFFMSFVSGYRIYMPDFSPDLLSLLQKPVSMVEQFKVLILGKLKIKVNRYIPEIYINSMGFEFIRSVKQYAIYVDFNYTFGDKTQDDLIKFV